MNILAIICFLGTLGLLTISRGLFEVYPPFAFIAIALAFVSGYFGFHFKGKQMLGKLEKYFRENPDIGFIRLNHYASSVDKRVGVKVVKGQPLYGINSDSLHCIKEGEYTFKLLNINKEATSDLVDFTVERGRIYDLVFNKITKTYNVEASSPREMRSIIERFEKVSKGMNL